MPGVITGTECIRKWVEAQLVMFSLGGEGGNPP
jgi:hypothetical protein